MDTRGARHLKTRLAIGAAVGDRVEIAATRDRTTEFGEVVSIGDGLVRIRLDSGAELVVDPVQIQLRRGA
jgi:hypothetical protein